MMETFFSVTLIPITQLQGFVTH